VIFGPLKTPGHDDHHGHADTGSLGVDIGGREVAILVPLALAVIILGVKPNIVLNTIEPGAIAVTQVSPVSVPGTPRVVAKTQATGPVEPQTGANSTGAK